MIYRRGDSVSRGPGLDGSIQAFNRAREVFGDKSPTIRPPASSAVNDRRAFDTVEAWEQFLTGAILMPQTIRYAETMIALKKEELELEVMSSKLPPGAAFIDPPGSGGMEAVFGRNTDDVRLA